MTEEEPRAMPNANLEAFPEPSPSIEVNPNAGIIPVGTRLMIDGKDVGVVTKVESNHLGQMVGEVQLDLNYISGHKYSLPTFSVDFANAVVGEQRKPGDLLADVRILADIERRKKWFMSKDRPGWVLIEAASNEKDQALVTNPTGVLQWVDMVDETAEETK